MIRLASNDTCTGCCACLNVCATNALQMKPDKEGFFRPVINETQCVQCRRCEEVCPVLHLDEQKTDFKASLLPEVECFAAWAEDSIREKSSSGGIFTVVAEWTLKKNGVVYGVAQHGKEASAFGFRRVERIEQLAALRGSKYVQAYAGNVYKAVKEDLAAKRQVLFAGTPCQIAALHSFLQKDYENLLTVDLVCHGVHSQKMLCEYLKENYRDTKAVSFRDERFGWTSLHLLVENNDGRKQTVMYEQSAYEKAFHTYTDLQLSCYHCPFAGLKRKADLSLGDFWGIDVFKKDWNDGKGTSLVLIHTERGKDIFQQILPTLKRAEQVPLFYAMGNRLQENIEVPRSRERFFALWEHQSFTESAAIAASQHYDIGLVGDWAVENYGANITYYALYKVLRDQLHYDVLLIERPRYAVWPPKDPPTLFRRLPYRSYEWEPYVQTKAELSALNEKCDAFILGSDQLWNNYLLHVFGEWADLSWVHNNHLKISYATSFGSDMLDGSRQDKEKLGHFLSQFDAISVREKSGERLLKQEFGIDGTQVLDPVFLCDKDNYRKLAEAENQQMGNKKPFIFSYTLDVEEEKLSILKKASNQYDCQLVVATDAAKVNFKPDPEQDIRITNKLSMEEWLANIQSCEYMITDSFHGMCFAILFHKPFIAIVNEMRGATRFYSLLSTLGLEERLAKNTQEANEKLPLLSAPIDWQRVDALIEAEKARSLRWLKNALYLPTKDKSLTSYDLLAPDVLRQSEHIGYVPNYSFMDVLPVQATSGKRTRFALGDQFAELQIFNQDKIEKVSRFALQEELVGLNEKYQKLSEHFTEYSAQTEMLQKQNELVKTQNELLKEQLLTAAQVNHSLLHSVSFRLGRILTWLPRKIRHLFKLPT